MGVSENNQRDAESLDSELNPDIKLRETFTWLKKQRKVLSIAVWLLVAYNIFGPILFIGHKVQSWPIAYVFGVGLGFSIASAIIGSFVGILLGLFPLRGLPYYLKLPLATLSGILLVNLIFALFATYQVLVVAGRSSLPAL